MFNFAERLKLLRKKINITQKQLAESIGLSERGVQSYEISQRKPNYDALIAISDYFKVSIDYLVGRSDDPQYEYYLQKTENALLLDMPEPFINLFKYAKTKGFKNELPAYEEHFQLIQMFQEWKNLCIATTEQYNQKSTHRDKYLLPLNPNEKFSKWKQLIWYLVGEIVDGVPVAPNPFSDRDINIVAKLQKLERNLESLIVFNPYTISKSKKVYLAGFPDCLIEYLYQVTEDDMKHPERR